MSLEIFEVHTQKEIKEFVKFQLDLYKGNEYYVPPTISDEMATFIPEKNPAFEEADCQLFLAKRDGKIVGRIAGIWSRAANKKYGYKNLRFSWIDCVEDYEVWKLLLDTVIAWGKKKGATTVDGPHGFNDFDMQGMLVEGFDRLATIASFYNYPYYPKFMERYGFEKEIDFVEFLSTTPEKGHFPEKLQRVNDYIMKKNHFHLLEYKTIKEILARADEIFALLEVSFEENFGTVPLTERQNEYYKNKYLKMLDPNLIKLVEDDNHALVGFIITMPNLSKAYQKANGHLFPFGFIHLLKGLKSREVLDFYFAGIRKDLRGKGVDSILASEIVKSAMNMGFTKAESNQELENNTLVQSMWKFYSPEQHKRRRIFKMDIK